MTRIAILCTALALAGCGSSVTVRPNTTPLDTGILTGGAAVSGPAGCDTTARREVAKAVRRGGGIGEATALGIIDKYDDAIVDCDRRFRAYVTITQRRDASISGTH